MSKRHTAIAFTPEWGEDLAEFLQASIANTLTNSSTDLAIARGISDCAELLYLHHFQLTTIEDPSVLIGQSTELASRYFFSDLVTDDVRNEKWFRAISSAMLVAAVGRQWDFLVRLAEWMQIDREPEYAGPLPYQIPQLYKVISAHLRETPMPGIDELFAGLEKCRTRAPTLLVQLWKTVRDRDQSAFETALMRSVKAYSSRPAQDPNDRYVGERIARVESFICAVAEHHGLEIPVLPPESAARVITAESVFGD